MTESQLQLLDVPAAAVEPDQSAEKPLTDRQAFALKIVEESGSDGIYTEEVGAAWCAQRGKHHVDERCQWCGKNGKQVLDALEKRGLVRYRRKKRDIPGAWFTTANYTADPSTTTAAGMLRDDQEIPF